MIDAQDLNWDLTPLIGNNSISSLLVIVEDLKNQLKVLKGQLFSSKDNFASFLSLIEKFYRISSEIECYLQNKSNSNLQDIQTQKVYQDWSLKYQKIASDLFFIRNEIFASETKINEYLNDEKFSYLKNYFHNFFNFKKHRLSDENEQLISQLSGIFDNNKNIFTKLTNADFKFRKIKDSNHKSYELLPGNASFFLSHKDIELRKNCYKNFWKVYFDHRFTLATNAFYNLLSTSKFAKIYHYKSSLESNTLSDYVDKKQYKFILKNISDNTNLILEWKKILVKVTKITNPNPWDWSGPLFEASNDDFTIEESKKIIKKSLSLLGPEYLKEIDYVFENNLIDWLPRPNKRSGAYSYCVYQKNPYILLNWNKKYLDVSTLTHELGHAIHSIFSNRHQSFFYHDYPIFLAEIASITNEILLNHSMIENTKDDEKKKAYLELFIKEFIATVFRQAQFAEYELIAHDMVDKDNSLTYTDFVKIAKKLNKKYFPKLETEKKSHKFNYLWPLYVPHFYSNFYVYKYVVGMVCASCFAKKIIDKEKDAVKNYLNFLKSGSSKKPLEILKENGIDLTTEQPFKNAFSLFNDYLVKLKKLVN
ncbi:oligoendopeptidase F [symbiont of Argiope bruennichi]|uniref:oligoendopeptidase F n=1 Tax=symbiont of Argiope bruennichi TaxID=2810479 RepID=UPI003DA34EAC